MPRQAPLSCLGRDEGEFDANDDDISALLEEVSRHAWNRLLRYLASREHSRLECRRYLDRTRVHHTISNQLLDKAEKLDYLDDNRFANLFARELLRKGKSRRAAYQSLRQRGIDEAASEQVLSDVYRPQEECEAVRRSAEKALRRTAGKPRKERWEKALASLARQGFSYEAASKALNELLNEAGE
ncbi:MAG: RecX family transcriptional regulator [Candidatus Cloacimonetes bacterium]|nr:RecX family transcriptional regulator [Candidatus Cloacimonadota bacterium]